MMRMMMIENDRQPNLLGDDLRREELYVRQPPCGQGTLVSDPALSLSTLIIYDMTPSPSRSTDPPHNDDQPHQSRVAPLQLLEQPAGQTLCKPLLAPGGDEDEDYNHDHGMKIIMMMWMRMKIIMIMVIGMNMIIIMVMGTRMKIIMIMVMGTKVIMITMMRMKIIMIMTMGKRMK